MTVRKLSRRTQAFFVSCLKSSLQSFVLLSSIYPYICLYVYLSTNPFPFSSLASSLVYRSHSSPYYHFPPQTYGRPAGKKSTGSYCHSLLLPLLPSLSASHFFHSSFAPSPPRSFPLGPKTPPSPLRHYHISPKVSSGVIAHITKTNASLPLRPSYFSPQNKRGRCFMLGSAVPRPFNPERDVSSAS